MTEKTKSILITSASQKVPMIKVVREAAVSVLGPEASLVTSDSDAQCVARYFGDSFWHMPCLEELSVEEVLYEVSQRNIGWIIPTRDGELSFWAKHAQYLAEKQINVMISPEEAIALCQDKKAFSSWGLSHGVPTIPTVEEPDLNSHDAKWVVKPRFGSGSRYLQLAVSSEQALHYQAELKNSYPLETVIQPYIEGLEYSIDIYCHSSEHIFCIARLREKVKDGESQITSSEHFPELEQAVCLWAKRFGLKYHAVAQVLVDQHGAFHLIEINPRFGGASTLSIAMGLHSFAWFLQPDRIPEFHRHTTEMRQVRYANDLIYEVTGP
jgi:carbamoyl-phosphate synthase large subunit